MRRGALGIEMKKGQEFVGIVERVDFPNKGIVRVLELEGQEIALAEQATTVTVKGVIEGQKIRALINKKRGGRLEARLLSVEEQAGCELAEFNCEHFGICGGCAYQNLPYEEQLALKARQITNLLSPIIGTDEFESRFEGVLPSPQQFGYRNKMEFSFGDEFKDGPLALGMHKKGSFYDIVTVDNCRLIHEDMRVVLRTTLAYFKEKKIDFYHKNTHEGYLRHLLVRRAAKTGEMLVDLVTAPSESGVICSGGVNIDETSLLEGWVSVLQSQTYEGSLVGILHTKNDRIADVIEDQGTSVLFGQDFFYEELLDLRFRITPFSFFQTNSLGAEVLYDAARRFILGADASVLNGKTVFDLYSGTGTIAQVLAPVSGKVIGVEIIEEAVEAAKKNAAENGLDNCDFLAGDVLKVIDDIAEKPDYIVLDPPRDGIHPKALQKIIDYGVESMIYISCKPTSLARDLVVLQEQGYQVERIVCCDMFPGTVHVETVCLLSKLKTPNHIEIDLKLTELDITAAESKATIDNLVQ